MDAFTLILTLFVSEVFIIVTIDVSVVNVIGGGGVEDFGNEERED